MSSVPVTKTVEPPEQRCPDGGVPDDAGLAARLNISVERLESLKRPRALTNAQICRLNEIRLARALERTDPFAPSFGAESLKWRALAERDELGNIPADGRLKAAPAACPACGPASRRCRCSRRR